MSASHWAYVAMLVFCLVGTLPLVAFYRLQLLRQPGRLVASIASAGVPFLGWDLWATHVGQWRFDPDQTLPWRVLGVPLEEVAFFVVIPLAAVITYETVLTIRATGSFRRPTAPLSPTPEQAGAEATR